MNILISIDLRLYTIIYNRWPNATVHEIENIDEMMNSIFMADYDLLVLDVAMPGGEQLENLIGKMIKHHKVVIFSSKNNHSELIKKLMSGGANAFLSLSATEAEIVNMLQYMLM